MLLMPSMVNGSDGHHHDMKYSELPEIFEDSAQVESDWYTLAAVTLLAFNKCDAVKELWEVVCTVYTEPEYQVIAARRFREAMMKASILVGFPRGINGLVTLRTCFTDEFAAKVGTKQRRGYHNTPDNDHETKIARGREFFSKVYAQHTNRVLTNLARGHPDLPTFAIESLYGELLSEFSIINEQSTSLIEMVACIATNSIPQAKGHVYGAKNMGESTELIQQCVQLIAHLSKIEGAKVEFGKMEFLAKVGVNIPIENGI